ncbi:hypothetical protein [Bernardetia sp. MNP-M8]|uniref:hypothetical protein n=1 Tax=Bernardetia sp. MNP-M8 TaxID=3127470 RepID=UPI0030D3E5CB
MNFVKVSASFFIFISIYFFSSISTFAQLDKNSCQEILGGLKTKDFEGLSLITHILTTDSLVQKPSIYVSAPLLLVFKENYLIIEGNSEKNQRSVYLPYNRIKFITTYNWKRIFSSGKTIEIHLMD